MTKAKSNMAHTITPYLAVSDARKAIDFYKKAFGAQETYPPMIYEGKVMHARITIGDSEVMLAEEMGKNQTPITLGGTPVGIHLNVDDVDTVFNRAVEAGAQVFMPVADMFWGDRYGVVVDPFGHRWSIATHIKDFTADEIKKNMNEFMAKAKATAKH